jgi:lipoprotein-anchoring transpeptidase ErfK/SrfK
VGGGARTVGRRLAAVVLCVCAAGCLPADGGGSSGPLAGATRPQAAGLPAARAAEAALRADDVRTARSLGVSRSRASSALALPAGSGHGRRVVYSIVQQRVWAVTATGSVQRTYLVSGRVSQPGPGTFRVFSRSRNTASAVSAETMEYMVRFTHGRRTGAPIGFHSIPVDRSGHPAQSVAQLGQPLSAGCIRQQASDAAFLWRFAPVGTKVVVVR